MPTPNEFEHIRISAFVKCDECGENKFIVGITTSHKLFAKCVNCNIAFNLETSAQAYEMAKAKGGN